MLSLVLMVIIFLGGSSHILENAVPSVALKQIEKFAEGYWTLM